MENLTILFKKDMKMSDLIDTDYKLLLLLHRLNISLGFGEKTVECVCKENNFDSNCFIFLANVQSKSSVFDVEKEFYKLPLDPFLYYLKSSHRYFLEQRLPNIKRKLALVFSESEPRLREMVMRFFNDYTKEVYEHMHYENDIVFPYIYALLDKTEDKAYSIKEFEERHNDIEDKMSDLKQILLKYVSGSTDQLLLINILMELYTSEEELSIHTFIEDSLVIPRVKIMENKYKSE